jgi:hypothetical protein
MSDVSGLLGSVLLANSLPRLPSNEDIEQMTEEQQFKLHELLRKVVVDFRDQSGAEIARLRRTAESLQGTVRTPPPSPEAPSPESGARPRLRARPKKGPRPPQPIARRAIVVIQSEAFGAPPILEVSAPDRRLQMIEKQMKEIARRCRSLQFGWSSGGDRV